MITFMGRTFSRGERGFTLVETMAALTVFSIMVLGAAPLLASAMRGSSVSRSYTVGKNLASQAIERARGLPYYVSESSRDLVDLYFPNLSTGYTTTPACTTPAQRSTLGTLVPCGPRFTTVCTTTTLTPAATGQLACPPRYSDGVTRLPKDYQVQFDAQFVSPNLNTNPETYRVVTPPTGFTSSSPAPPSQLLYMSVTVNWTQGSAPKAYQLITLLGDRKLSPDKIRASANVDFLAQVVTSYRESTGRLSTLKGVIGRSVSNISLRNVAQAEQESTAAQFTLAAQEFGGVPAPPPVDRFGATGFYRAPPDVSISQTSGAATDVDAPIGVVLAGNKVAGVTPSTVNEPLSAAVSKQPGLTVSTQLPFAAGNFGVNIGSGQADEFWATNQADTSSAATLRLAAGAARMFSVQRPQGSSATNRLGGDTYAMSTAMTPANLRKVESHGFVQVPEIRIMPTTFQPNGVIQITNFRAQVDCTATGLATGNVASGSWSATFRYSKKFTGQNNVGYTDVALSGSTTSTATDPLLNLKGRDGNPPIATDPVTGETIYLFEDPTQIPARKGYLESLFSTPTMTSSVVGSVSRVNLASAINLVTTKLDPTNAQSALSIQIGKLSCEAVDNRA
jgi:prepilin-type N-terminal cleavage/methylation domain-containing protein